MNNQLKLILVCSPLILWLKLEQGLLLDDKNCRVPPVHILACCGISNSLSKWQVLQDSDHLNVKNSYVGKKKIQEKEMFPASQYSTIAHSISNLSLLFLLQKTRGSIMSLERYKLMTADIWLFNVITDLQIIIL